MPVHYIIRDKDTLLYYYHTTNDTPWFGKTKRSAAIFLDNTAVQAVVRQLKLINPQQKLEVICHEYS